MPPSWPIDFRTALLRATLYILFIGGIAQGAYLEALYLPSSLSDLRLMDELRRGFFTPPVLVLVLALVLLCGS